MTLVIDGISDRAEGVGREGGRAVFVPFAIPGERVTVAEASRSRRRSARLLRVDAPSPDRVTPDCRVFGECGGCQLRHVRYPAQLALKARILQDALRTVARLEAGPIEVAPSPRTLGYRNHVRVRVEAGPDGGARFGFFGEESRRLVPFERCQLMPEPFLPALEALREPLGRLARRRRLAGEVWLRHAENTGETLVTLVGLLPGDGVEALAAVPGMCGVLHKPSSRERPAARPLWGKDHLVEEALGVRFSLRAESFFQVNTPQARALFSRVVSLAGRPAGPIVDAYCGVGVLARLLAARGWRAVGIELQHDTVEWARRDASADPQPVEFIAGAVEEALPRLVKEGLRPAAAILDPPRAGCHERVLDSLRQAEVRRLIMVSCHPGTLARDLHRLFGRGYRLGGIEAFDMFPHTAHLECLATLDLG
ncbi:MAG: class I SAM-dependent RNA methyltransferase [Myxococcales bacterium]|nr:class I SAM-dependent RNA methyltransferase [Myxococcales bacterium]